MNDSLLKRLNTILGGLNIPAEIGVFTDTPPNIYCVLTPLTDTLSEFADNKPSSEVQEVRISLYCKGNYISFKNKITRALLENEITITARQYIGLETDSGYHHYNFDAADCVRLGEF